MNDSELREMLEGVTTIAVVGASTNPAKASNQVPKILIDAGYTVIPVHPTADEILGRTVYPTLADIPVPVDIVDVFRPAAEAPVLAEQAAAIGCRNVLAAVGHHLTGGRAGRRAGRPDLPGGHLHRGNHPSARHPSTTLTAAESSATHRDRFCSALTLCMPSVDRRPHNLVRIHPERARQRGLVRDPGTTSSRRPRCAELRTRRNSWPGGFGNSVVQRGCLLPESKVTLARSQPEAGFIS